MDLFGQILWFAILLTPLLIIPLVWRQKKLKKIYRIIIGLLIALLISFFLYHISLSIIFRDGIGP
jgi:membrane protein DedA with SNARE-associated domain